MHIVIPFILFCLSFFIVGVAGYWWIVVSSPLPSPLWGLPLGVIAMLCMTFGFIFCDFTKLLG